MALVRGDMEAGVAKLRRAVGAARLRPADAAAVRSVGAAAGYASPVGLAAEALHVVVDELVAVTPNLVSGANEPGYHLLNVCCGRDYQPHQVADIAVAFQGAECPRCAAPLEIGDSVELASLQGLGPELSQALGATYQARDGHARPLWIGWYALELDRLLACIAEGHRDEHGLTLPASVAPYAVYLIALGGDAALAERADRLYAELRGSGLDVLYDDRDVSAGVKFNDADLVGIPLRITVSARGLQEDMIELKLRGTAARQAVPGREAAARARELIARLEAREPGRAG
jgi:prolyl-tRNA synthetase